MRDGSPFARVVRVPRLGSTNAELAEAIRREGAAGPQEARRTAWPHLSVLVTDHQAQGRGRAGRGWQTPPGVALTASVVLRPGFETDNWGWLALLGGLAVARGIRARTHLTAALKWPNDVVLIGAGTTEEPGWGRDRKVAGVLAEAVRPASGPPVAVLGFGVNVHQAAADLPVPWATSLAAAGADAAERDLTALLDAVGRELAALEAAWRGAGGDAGEAGLAAAVAAECSTLGRRVRVDLPGGGEIVGRAAGLADDGALVVRPDAGPPVHVTAGDVAHIRVLRAG